MAKIPPTKPAVVSAYVCAKCGAIYWDSNIWCDCSTTRTKMNRASVVMNGPSLFSLRKLLGTLSVRIPRAKISK